jgi:hypothetical protein
MELLTALVGIGVAVGIVVTPAFGVLAGALLACVESRLGI